MNADPDRDDDADADADADAASVLIVEDEPMIGRILEHKLRREGHAVQLVTSAADADAVARAGGVDVALVDVTLESDGIELARTWAAAGRAPRVGWLALIEQRDRASALRAAAAGADGVVPKPFKPTEVAHQVLELMQRARR